MCGAIVHLGGLLLQAEALLLKNTATRCRDGARTAGFCLELGREKRRFYREKPKGPRVERNVIPRSNRHARRVGCTADLVAVFDFQFVK